MRLVSVLAPDSIVGRALHDAYAPFVTPSLLADWQHHPQAAPGRRTSTPYPARIEIDSVQANGSDCRVHGKIVEVTSTDTATAVDRMPVTLRLSDENGWRISAFATSTSE